jgi:transposase-like protein
MARVAQRPEFWAIVVAEAQAGGQTLEQVAAKHGVSEAALKYHLYKNRRATAKPAAPGPRVLPVRVERQSSVVEAQFGSLRLSFRDSCDPTYVAAVLSALGKC